MTAASTGVARLLGRDMVAALASFGAEPVDAVSITGLPGERSRRATFRIRLADGRIVKARRLRRAARVDRYARIVRAMSHEQLPPPLLVSGCVALEPWIDGTPVAALPPSRERLIRAADLLGSIHAPSTAHGRAETRSTGPLVASTRRRIAELAGRGALTPADVAASLDALRHLAPAAAEVGVTHNDFCAENLVEDARGRLVVVDNEGLRRGFLDYDLARTWYRWPMPARDWRLFTDRYQSWRRRPIDPDPLPFWRIAALVKSASTRAARRTVDAATPIDRLRVLLATHQVARPRAEADSPRRGRPAPDRSGSSRRS